MRVPALCRINKHLHRILLAIGLAFAGLTAWAVCSGNSHRGGFPSASPGSLWIGRPYVEFVIDNMGEWWEHGAQVTVGYYSTWSDAGGPHRVIDVGRKSKV